MLIKVFFKDLLTKKFFLSLILQSHQEVQSILHILKILLQTKIIFSFFVDFLFFFFHFFFQFIDFGLMAEAHPLFRRIEGLLVEFLLVFQLILDLERSFIDFEWISVLELIFISKNLKIGELIHEIQIFLIIFLAQFAYFLNRLQISLKIVDCELFLLFHLLELKIFNHDFVFAITNIKFVANLWLFAFIILFLR